MTLALAQGQRPPSAHTVSALTFPRYNCGRSWVESKDIESVKKPNIKNQERIEIQKTSELSRELSCKTTHFDPRSTVRSLSAASGRFLHQNSWSLVGNKYLIFSKSQATWRYSIHFVGRIMAPDGTRKIVKMYSSTSMG